LLDASEKNIDVLVSSVPFLLNFPPFSDRKFIFLNFGVKQYSFPIKERRYENWLRPKKLQYSMENLDIFESQARGQNSESKSSQGPCLFDRIRTAEKNKLKRHMSSGF
jgi:hypothetical protein